MDIRFLFWNVRDKDETTIGDVINELLPSDIVCLAETNVSDTYFSKLGFKLVYKISRKDRARNEVKFLKIYASQKGFNVMPAGDYGNGEIIGTVLEVNSKKVLLVAMHLLSNLSVKNEEEKLENFIKYRNFIETLESSVNPVGTIVFGDFNTNPFEKGFCKTQGLFSIDLLNPPPRRLKKIPYFINPTISQLGHFSYYSNGDKKPPGSYYYKQKNFAISTSLFWNTFDGMIFRPALLNNYQKGSELKIITKTKNHSLFDEVNYKINNNYSDHLPITFTFNFK
jgi:hypothetical protein